MLTIDDAARHYRAGDGPAAEQACRAILAQTPDHYDARHLLGVLRLDAGDADDALAQFALASRLLPSDPQLQFHIGCAYGALKQFERAEAAYLRTLALQPRHGGALNNLATARYELRRFAEAEAACRELLAFEPRAPQALYNLGRTLVAQDRFDAAIAAFTAALSGNANLPPARVADIVSECCMALVAVCRYQDALTLCRSQRQATGDSPSLVWNESLAHLILGDYAEGWRLYESRFDVPDHDPRRPGAQVLDLAAVSGKRVVVHPEQGRGDLFQFARYLPMLAGRGARVIVETYPDLMALFERIEGVDTVVAYETELPPHDLLTPLLSLPLAFGTTVETIPAAVPYLSVPPDRMAGWAQRLGSATRPRIGLGWRGLQHIPQRSIPPAILVPLLERTDVGFHALHNELPDEQRGWLATQVNLADHSADLTDFADTAALIAQMDLVITIDTSVAHLAGALGVPAWILLHRTADWRWLTERDDSPWYPTVRLFRQRTQGDWAEVLRRVATALDAWMPLRTR